MPVKTLAALCLHTILKHIELVSGLGHELPHDNPHVQRILSKVSSAKQLREIELNSPQLQGHTEKFWIELIRREFPGSRKKNYVPSDPTGWWKIYKRHKKEHDESLDAATAALKNAFDGLAAEKGKNVSLLVNRSQLPKPPRTGRALRTRGTGQRNDNTGSLSFTSGSRTKLTSGKNVLKRARREAMDVAAKRGVLGKTTRPIGAPSTQMKAAPPSLREHHRVAAQPEFRVPSGLTTNKPVPARKRDSSPAHGRKGDSPNPIVVDVSSGNDVNPLFDDIDAQSPPAKRPRLSLRRSTPPPKDPLFDSDGDESPRAKPAPAKPKMTPSSGAGPSKPAPLKRTGAAVLPGKPGASRFLAQSSTSSGKTSVSKKPLKSSPPPKQPVSASAAGAKAPAKPSPGSGAGAGAGAGRASSPQGKPSASGSAPQPPIVRRKPKVDIFMKPRKRP